MTDPPATAPAQRTTAQNSPPSTRSARGGLFRHHDFRQLLVGDTISQIGTQLSGLALPVLAVKLLGATAFEMGLLTTFEFLAFW